MCGGLARCFALTPSPSPTRWERDVGGARQYALRLPLARLAGEGDTGGEGNKARLPSNPRALILTTP